MSFKEIVGRIAEAYGVTTQEVERQMADAIWEAVQTEDPMARTLWEEIISDEPILSVEGFVIRCAELLNARNIC